MWKTQKSRCHAGMLRLGYALIVRHDIGVGVTAAVCTLWVVVV